MSTKARSPNYPNHSLALAIPLVEKIYKLDGRNKVSRDTLAKHLGHESLSGPALAKIGALRAYGLLEGSGDELRVSDDAVTVLKAPEGSEEIKDALVRLADRPSIFQEIRAQFPSRTSRDNLIFWLIKQKNFTDTAASIAATSYLETMEVIDRIRSPSESTDSLEPHSDPYRQETIAQPSAVRPMPLASAERVVFVEGVDPANYLKLIAAGELDEYLLEALDDFVQRQIRRLRGEKAKLFDVIERSIENKK